MKKKITELLSKRSNALNKLAGPARAAANQMKDAKMDRGADPILEILFELDAIDQELTVTIRENPLEAFKLAADVLEERNRD